MINKSYGITLQSHLNDVIDRIIEEVHIEGFSIIENVLTDNEIIKYREKIDTVYQIQKNHFNEQNLIKINEKGLARCLLANDQCFLTIATNDIVLKVVEKILGNYFILHLQNGIINKPNEEHHQSSWHRDLPYQNFIISRPLSINALYCIDDFTKESGSTCVLPFSHREEIIPSAQYIEKHSKQLLTKAGSVIIFDSMLLHKAGYNYSNFTRRSINNVYTVPILKQQIDLPNYLKEKYADDAFLSKFLGYKSSSAFSDIEWREKRLNK